MSQQFKDTKILVVNDHETSRSLQMNLLKVLGFKTIDSAYEMTDGFRTFKAGNHDIILASLDNGKNDAIGLAKLVRHDAASPNKIVPIIAVAGKQALHLMDAAREVGITDLLQAPYAVDDVAQKLSYALTLQEPALEQAAAPQEAPVLPAQEQQQEQWPETEEAFSLTHMLLDHYLNHHKIVLAKLKFAQNATKHCIDEVNQTHKKVKTLDNTNIHTFKDFDKMWEDILDAFIQGGIGEDELFKIEKLITSMPRDIKEHYNDLSAQDKTFLTLVGDLNTNAYRKAKEKVTKLQAQPNALNGKTPADYAAATKAEGPKIEATIFEPRHKK